MKWQNLEKKVSSIASYKWDAQSNPETINGVKIDCVLKVKPDYWIIIEITKENTLSKLRTDLAKFASVKPFLFSQSIYAECYFITFDPPPPSLRDTGQGHNVTVLSIDRFEKIFFDFEKYHHGRSQRKFGSAVDPASGQKDTKNYVPVKYSGVTTKKDYSVEEIGDLLYKGHRIVLLGNYGTGKSRCIQELFLSLSQSITDKLFYPIAIDLRENWGTKRGHELIQRHFDDLGLPEQARSIVKILENSSLCFLLDGFDEIGSQTWSDNPIKLGKIRAEALQGVKDLLQRCNGGAIVTGREHYFNSEEEMYKCLGLKAENTILLRCEDEFSDDEMLQYLNSIAPGVELPQWLPRRPLICQIISGMEAEIVKALSSEDSGETAFWNSLILALCEREARIHTTLDAAIIRRVLRVVSRLTRSKSADVGPISITELNKSFEVVTGLPPVDEAAIMLQRLPGLGRLASESSDRQFVDHYILDGLRAEDVVELSYLSETEVVNEKWTNPLRRFGLTLLSQDIETTSSKTSYLRLMKKSSERQNKVLAGDILSALLCSETVALDLENFELTDSHINYLDCSHKPIKRLKIRDSIIDEIDITECQANDVEIKDCIIQKVDGVSAAKGLPKWMKDNDVSRYEAVDTVSRIKKAKLSKNHRIFITLAKKLFFQPGTGRKEEALLRGLGSTADSKIADRIIKLMMTQKIIDRFKGKEGWVYIPKRKHARRMSKIMTKLSLSDDPLWIEIDKY